MKFNELKSRLKERFLITASAGVLAFSLIVTGVTCTVYADKNTEETGAAEDTSEADTDELVDEIFDGEFVEKEIDKEETVYIIADANGTPSKTVVSDHLYNRDGAATLEDKSNLTDIENVKGNEEYTESNGNLVWKADGKDIYYQGQSTKELPVSTSVTYYLDGKQIQPADLAGKSGKVTIRYDYKNNTSYTGKVNGKEMTVCVPFAAVSALVLNDDFKNIEVTNGKLMETSAGNVVVGYAVPGLSDSLKLSKKNFKNFNIPEYFEMTADVENFSLDIAMTVVANAGSYISSGEISLDSLDDVVNTLADACEQLDSGSTELATGMTTLRDGLKAYTDGVAQLNKGINTLAGSATELVSGVNQLGAGVLELVNTVEAMPETVKAGINKTLNELNTTGFASAVYASGYNKDAAGKITVSNIENITSFVASHETQIETALLVGGLHTNGVTSFDAYASNLITNFDGTWTMIEGANPAAAAYKSTIQAAVTASKAGYEKALVGCYKGLGAASVYSQIAGSIPTDKLAELKAGTNKLIGAMPELTSGIKQLKKGSNQLASKNEELMSGANKLVEGSTKLSDGITKLNKDGVQKILNAYNGDVKELVDRIQVVLDAAESYGIYSDVADGKNASVKFITKVAPIKAE